MRAIETLQTWRQFRPQIRLLRPIFEHAAFALRSRGIKPTYLTSQGVESPVPAHILPATRFFGNMVRNGYSPEEITSILFRAISLEHAGAFRTARSYSLSDIYGNSPAIFGGQFGDEGKGRIAYYIADYIGADGVVRFNGGSNAGKIITVASGKQYEFCMLPAGALYKDMSVYFARGIKIDPVPLMAEIDFLKRDGLDVMPRLFISSDCHITLPYHRTVSLARNMAKSREGSHNKGMAEFGTGQGVGVTEILKRNREGIRICDLFNGSLRRRIIRQMNFCTHMIQNYIGDNSYDFSAEFKPDAVYEQMMAFAGQIRDTVRYDMPALLSRRILAGDKLLFEGTQALMLDLDFGLYENATSAPTTYYGLLQGTGLSISLVPVRIGLFKSYMAVRGMTPLPTEMTGNECGHLQETANEYDTLYDEDGLPAYQADGKTIRYKTDSPIALGWQDALCLRYIKETDLITHAILTKLDVFDRLERLKIAIAYRYKGTADLTRIKGLDTEIEPGTGKIILKTYPMDSEILKDCEPIYEELPGWASELKRMGLSSITGIRHFKDLPPSAQRYVRRLEEILGMRFIAISVGPKREDIIQVVP